MYNDRLRRWLSEHRNGSIAIINNDQHNHQWWTTVAKMMTRMLSTQHVLLLRILLLAHWEVINEFYYSPLSCNKHAIECALIEDNETFFFAAGHHRNAVHLYSSNRFTCKQIPKCVLDGYKHGIWARPQFTPHFQDSNRIVLDFFYTYEYQYCTILISGILLITAHRTQSFTQSQP